MHKDFITITDYSKDEFNELIDLSFDIKENPCKYRKSCEGLTLGMIFEKKSTRTRVSFEVGIFQLGGVALFLSPNDLQLGRGETIEDTAKVLSRYLDGIMARTYSHQTILDLAKYGTCPVINGLSDYNHPCQALTDYFSIKEAKGKTKGLKITYIGDGNNMAHSLMLGAPKVGMDITIITPKGYEPSEDVVKLALTDCEKFGTKLELTNDIEAACCSDVIYTDVWASMGMEEEEAKRKEIFMPYQVNDNVMKMAKNDAIFMHCLPAHRGDEVSASVIDSDQSIVIDQAENRLHCQKAVMYKLMAK
ncbi:MAG: ornithine carbamoyltransferase [Pseudomonadota bacterium]